MRAASARAASSAALELLDPGDVRRIGREPRIPVTGYDGHVTDRLRLNPTELVVELRSKYNEELAASEHIAELPA